MKFLFLVPRLDKASTRYRVLQYLPFLEAAGHTAEVVPLSRTGRKWPSLIRRLRQADAVVIQKKLLAPVELFLVHRASRRLIYDLDDAVMFKDGPATSSQQQRQRRRFGATAGRADLVIAGNRYLAEQTRGFNPRVDILPTPLDLSRYPSKSEAQRSETVTLGWIGSRSTLHYLERLAPVLEELGRRHRHLQLKIVADAFFDLQQLPVLHKRWTAEEEISDLHSFDIGLMPLTEDPWSRGKCGFKLLQCMAVGVPVICSPVGMNTEIVEAGIEGAHAATPEEWLARIEQLAGDEELRRQMGRKGREKVAKHYSLAVNAPLFLRSLEKGGCG